MEFHSPSRYQTHYYEQVYYQNLLTILGVGADNVFSNDNINIVFRGTGDLMQGLMHARQAT